MCKKRLSFNILIGLVTLIFSTGFICNDSNYQVPAVQFMSPANGAVIPAGTTSVTVQGKVIAGDSAVRYLKYDGTKISFDKDTGDFSCELPLTTGSTFSSYDFELTDSKLYTNIERLSLSIGDSLNASDPTVLGNAARIFLNENTMDKLEVVGASFCNTWKNDLIYGWNGSSYSSHDAGSPFINNSPVLPIREGSGFPGDIIIDHGDYQGGDKQGLVNLGNMQLSIDIQNGNKIAANLNITPEAWVDPGSSNKAVFVQGYHKVNIIWDVKTGFSVSGTGVSVTGGEVTLRKDSDGKIIATINFSNSSVSVSGLQIKYGTVAVPGFLEDFIMDKLEDAISGLRFELPLMNIDDIATAFEGADIMAWPMNSNIFTSTSGSMQIDLGFDVAPSEGVAVVDPNLTSFFATPGDPLPEAAVTENENLVVAISDDMINQLAFGFYQAGIMNDLDITDPIKSQLPESGNDDMSATVSMTSPPVCSLSSTPADPNTTVSGTVSGGRVIIKNMVIELKDAVLSKGLTKMSARISVNANVALKLKLSDDGTKIQACIDPDDSVSDIKVLYSSIWGSSAVIDGLIGLAGDVSTELIDRALQEMITVEIPTVDLYGSTISIRLLDTELMNNSIVARLLLQ
ncbi:MAG: hypothetical protein GY754_19855 [bacterium]|nr:hypothetical protein [bacterium]